MSDSLKKSLRGIGIAVGIPVAAFVIAKLIAPDLVRLSQFKSMLIQAIFPAILAWGVMCELKSGIWDFSVGANVLICEIIGGNLAKSLGLGVPGVIFFSAVIGTLIGYLIGKIFIMAKIPSIIVSVGAMLLLESLSCILYEGNGIRFGPSILIMSTAPYNVIFGIVCALIAWLLYTKRPFGFHVRLIGSSINIARQNGIDIDKTRIKIFMMTGLFCGFYGVMELGSSGVVTSKSNMASMGIIFSAIICVFIAMTIEKWVNLVVGIYVGAVVASIIRLTILVTGGSNAFQQVIMASILIIVFAVQNNLPKLLEKRRKGSLIQAERSKT